MKLISVTCTHSLLFHIFTHSHKHQDVCVCGLLRTPCVHVYVWHRGQGTVAPESLGCLLGLSWSGTTNHNSDKLFYDFWESRCHGMTMISVLHFSSSLILRQGYCPSSVFSHSGCLYCCLPVEWKGMGHLWCDCVGAQTCWSWCVHIPYYCFIAVACTLVKKYVPYF